MDVRHAPLAAGRGVLDAQRIIAGIDAVDAIAISHALPDIVDAAFHQLFHDMRVGDMGTGHRRHVDMALGDRAGGGVQVSDALGMEHRHADLALDGARQRQERRDRERHVRQADGVGDVVARLSADQVDEIDEARARNRCGRW